MSPEEGRSALRDLIADLHEEMDMGAISVMVLDELCSYFEGVNAIGKIIRGDIRKIRGDEV